MMLIFVPSINSRIEYTFDLIFNELIGIEYRITDNMQVFKDSKDHKFVYDKTPIDNVLFFPAHNLLFETEIKHQKVEKIDFEDCVGIFEISSVPHINFDLFASTFYLVSRYEEYLPHHVDRYGRFGSSVSMAYVFRFLRKPMVNYYARLLLKILESNFGPLPIREKKFELLLTYDIDNAYEYKGKGILQQLFSLGSYLSKFQIRKFFDRIGVVLGGKKDPFDIFDKMDRWHKKHNVYPFYFILLAIRRSKQDSNIKYNKRILRSLVKRIAESYEIGAHPSYYSASSPKMLEQEIKLLSKYTDKEIRRSRQHFLKMHLPDTYHQLIQQGILEDHTMGYSSRPGFRASICQPFYWFDLRNNASTALRVFPFAFMDATFKYYKRYRSEKIRERLFELYHETKQFKGTFITVFHNDILAEERFSKIYEGFLAEVS
jgi:hypothetical protein